MRGSLSGGLVSPMWSPMGGFLLLLLGRYGALWKVLPIWSPMNSFGRPGEPLLKPYEGVPVAAAEHHLEPYGGFLPIWSPMRDSLSGGPVSPI